MNSPATDTAAILAGVGALSLRAGTNLFVSTLPDTGDTLTVCLYDTGGYDAVDAIDKASVARPTIQILVRGSKAGYQAAYAKAAAIDTQLHLKTETTQGGTRYLAFYRVGDINSIGQDDNGRPLLTINYRIDRTV
jgi:hypothetical protein